MEEEGGKRKPGEEEPAKELIWHWRWLKSGVIGLTIGGMILFLVLVIVNTRSPGILGYLSKYKIFLFNGSWGSSRGATWRDGFAIYESFSWRERLFGIGQDCFAIYGYSVPELAARLKEEWPNSRLTNAHNECITHLVNVGIFGMICFIGIFWSSFRRLWRERKKSRYVMCLRQAFCLIFYITSSVLLRY